MKEIDGEWLRKNKRKLVIARQRDRKYVRTNIKVCHLGIKKEVFFQI